MDEGRSGGQKRSFPPIGGKLGFYVVVPDAENVKKAIDAGCDTIQLREKNLSGSRLMDEIVQCVEMAKKAGARLFINDHYREAGEAGAYGVHLGQEDLDDADIDYLFESGMRLGISTHSYEEMDRALGFYPSYMATGAIFPTTTKKMKSAPQGLDNLGKYVKWTRERNVSIPIVAIGGIDLTNAEDVLKAGADSLAVVRAFTLAEDPVATTEKFRELLKKYGKID